MSNCSHEAWDFGALQCPDCGAVKGHVADADYAKLEADAQALREEVERGNRITVAMALDISAVGEALGIPGEEQEGGTGEFIDLIRELQKEVAALRARVAVVPDGYALVPVEPTREMFIAINKEDDKAYAGGCHHGAQFEWLWAAAIEAAPRPNGLTVSEGLLRKWLELMEHGDYREGHCMCGSSVDGHGIGDGHAPVDAGEYYAGQVMEELRALLSEQDGGKP
ncbi:TPA: hypothetical protein ACVGJ1_002850 [Pseudomonas aeruginosa]